MPGPKYYTYARQPGLDSGVFWCTYETPFLKLASMSAVAHVRMSQLRSVKVEFSAGQDVVTY